MGIENHSQPQQGPGPRPAGPQGRAPQGMRPGPQQPGPRPAASTPLALRAPTRGIVRGEPLRVVVHGSEGSGKTTFAANAPRCLVIGAEDGSAEIPVFGRVSPATWEEVLGYLDALLAGEGDYAAYQSIALDTLDWLEPLCWEYTCRKANKASIEAFGFGKGFTAALDEWRVLLARIRTLQQKRRLNVIAIAHSQLKTFKNPDANQGDYDRFQLKLNEKAAGLWKEWAKAVLFFDYERATVEVGQNRHKGIDTGARKIYARMTAKYDAKNRYWLPAEMPLSWAAFAREVKATEDLRGRFDTAVMGLPEEQREAIQEEIEKNDYSAAYVEQVIAGLGAAAAK